MIETFTHEQFERALTDAGLSFDSLGWLAGERCYHVHLDAQSGIRVRSSIRHDGVSAKVGEDSIRAYLVGPDAQPLVAKSVANQERWIARTPGWQQRLIATIDKLRLLRQAAGDCRACGAPNQILISRTPRNPNRPFSKCSRRECGKWGAWLGLDRVEQQAPLPTWAHACSKHNGHPVNLPLDKPCLCGATPPRVGADKPLPSEAKSENGAGLSVPTPGGLAAFGAPITIDEPQGAAPAPPRKPFTPSPLQVAIGDFVANDTRNLRVEAVAGSGKTTTNVYATTRLPRSLSVRFMVFSKANQLDMAQKVESHVEATTAHAAGLADIRRAIPNVKVDERKMWGLLRERYEFSDEVQDNAAEILRLVGLCKNMLREPTPENLDYLCDRFGIAINGSLGIAYNAAARLYRDSLEMRDMVDFDDMVMLPALGVVPASRCDVLFVDEAQDTNKAQQEYYLRVGKRIIFVGDKFQAIYGFRGSDTDAMDNLSRALNAEQLPLSISYRCPRAVIALAKTIVPQIEARPDAPEGVVADLPPGRLLATVRDGDFVLCRLNAPLVKPAFALIAEGRKAVIKGRDTGKGLMVLVRKVERKFRPLDFHQLIRDLTRYVESETHKFDAAHKSNQAATLQDQFETIIALSDGCCTVADLEKRVNKVFSDDAVGVTFSTVHKAKGLESRRVFILKPELMPFPRATEPWQVQQEQNCLYVAYTRALEELYFVR